MSIQDFCNQFNEATKEKSGEIIPAEITVYEDRSFTFKLKTSPTSFLLRKAAGLEKGSKMPKKENVGKVTRADLREIAEKKMQDLNADDVHAAEKIIEGTARSMGIEVTK